MIKLRETDLLTEMCSLHAPCGEELTMKEYILDYILLRQSEWKVQPTIIHGNGLQDCLLLVFGKPRTAIFAHMDSIGFTVKYEKELVRIGKPVARKGIRLKGQDSQGDIRCSMNVSADENRQFISYDFDREIDRGTSLTFDSEFRETDEFVQSCYMDNRLGVYAALQVARTLENGIIAFSSWEEHGGGSVGYLAKYMFEKYEVRQALISDITWVTAGVKHGEGVAISMRDSGIPRRPYVDKIIEIARKSGIPFQLEVEDAGGSDGNELQKSAYPFDWCFVGAPEDNVHSPDEIVHKNDILSMIRMYEELMKKL